MFATAEERKYPFLFCKRLAKLVVAQLAPELNISGSTKAATKMQPRRGDNEIVREYRYIAVLNSTNQAIKVKDVIAMDGGKGKVLSITEEGGEFRAEDLAGGSFTEQ
eukprot:9550057-Karenia_brevis.AAC.1